MGRKGMRILAIAGLLIVAGFAMMPSASATRELRITDYNLNSLQNWGTWTPYSFGELLIWEGYPSILDVNCQKLRMVGTIRAVSVDDNQCTGKYYGHCVSLVKALSKSNVPTTSSDNNHWTRGVKVMSQNVIAPGTAIATFTSNGVYSGHVAVFRGRYSNSQGNGILVWDQNYVSPHVVGRHSIKAKGTTYPTDVNNANNYYTVVVP
jgi:hypothetical protein